MKIQVVSDLHQEFGSMDISFEQADVVIFAGDVNLGTKGVQWILSKITNVPVIYVLGNHEYYRGSYPKTLNKIIDLSLGTNVHVLESKSIIIDDITFHGTTLWTDFELPGDARTSGSICQGKMNDYKLIRRDPSYSKLRSIDTYIIHRASIQWLQMSLESSSTKKNVVVTHHAPSARSLPEKLQNNVLSSAYASNLESTILKYQPEYWIHGHIHEPAKYKVGETTVLCNPHGYMNEPYNGFDKNLIVEI